MISFQSLDVMKRLNGLNSFKKVEIIQNIFTSLQMVSIGKRKKKVRTRGGDDCWQGKFKILYITNFYKTLFGALATNNFSLREDLVADIPQLSVEENNILSPAIIRQT